MGSRIETEKKYFCINNRELLEKIKILDYKLVSEGKAEVVMAEVESLFGEPMKLSEIPESKQDIFEVLIEDMRSM